MSQTYLYDPLASQLSLSSDNTPSAESSISFSAPFMPDTPVSSSAAVSPPTVMSSEPPALVASSSSTTITSTTSTSTVDFLTETMAKASSLPDSFYPEFLQYSKESYELSAGRKKKCLGDESPVKSLACFPSQHQQHSMSNSSVISGDDTDIDDPGKNLSSAELRRKIHIQSEQKRRAQIKDGFEDLRNELPTCLNKKMSKVALLHRTVQHIQHLKDTQTAIMAEMERLVHENDQLRRFQQSMLQKQAIENMYSMGNL